MDENKKPFEVYIDLKDSFDSLENLKSEHFKLYETSAKANEGNVYVTDLFINSVLKRSLDLLDSFIILVTNWHYTISGALLRMQIDNMSRIYYISKRNDRDFFKEFSSGKSFRNLKHTDGEKLTDRKLIDIAKEEFPWLEKVYKETSEFIHLSSKHSHTTITAINEKEKSIESFFGIGFYENWPKESIKEITYAFYTVTNIIIDIVKGWINFKVSSFKDNKS